jgi:Uma2 family endonuclease
MQLDRTRKVPAYAGHEVAHLWIIDPKARTLEVFRLADGSWLMESAHSGDELVRAVPFDAIEIELGALWIDGSIDGQSSGSR